MYFVVYQAEKQGEWLNFSRFSERKKKQSYIKVLSAASTTEHGEHFTYMYLKEKKSETKHVIPSLHGYRVN